MFCEVRGWRFAVYCVLCEHKCAIMPNYAIFNLFNITFLSSRRFLSSKDSCHLTLSYTQNTPRAFISDTQTIATLPGMHAFGPKPLFTVFSGSRGLPPKPPNCGVAQFRWRSTVNLCRVCQVSTPIYCNASKWLSCAMLEVRHLLQLNSQSYNSDPLVARSRGYARLRWWRCGRWVGTSRWLLGLRRRE